MSDFDKAARYQVKQDPAGFLRWLFQPAAPALVFHDWFDARRLALPVEGDLTCDTVGWLRLPEAAGPEHLLIVEIQAESRAELLKRLLGYIVRLHGELPAHDASWQVGGAVVNLTGPPQPDVMTLSLPGVPGCELRFKILQRTLRDENAGETLAEIAAGHASRWLLPWIPLMRDGDQSGIMEQWRQAAEMESDVRARAILATLTRLFSELADRATPWHLALEGWDVQKSMFAESLREEGREEGRIQAQQEDLLALLTDKFGSLPDDVVQRIRATKDGIKLSAALRQVLHLQALADLQLLR